MGNIEQTYAWSESRVKVLRECAWKYFLTYFQAWEGWLRSAPQEKQQAYMFKNMTNMPMFVGSIVHDVIEHIIKTGRDTGEWMEPDAAVEMGVQKLRKGWIESTQKRWQSSPKLTNLEEHYYDIDIPKDRLDAYKQKVIISIKSFFQIGLFQIMKSLPKDAWLSLEEFQKFSMKDGEEVTVKIDCGFRHGGKVYLLDWKTGRVNDAVIDQLVTYAMYAWKQGWIKKLDDVIIVPVYLFAFAELGERAVPQLDVTMKDINRQTRTIQKEYPILTEAFENKDNPDFFPRTDNEKACERCMFRGMCKGAVTEIDDDATPF